MKKICQMKKITFHLLSLKISIEWKLIKNVIFQTSCSGNCLHTVSYEYRVLTWSLFNTLPYLRLSACCIVLLNFHLQHRCLLGFFDVFQFLATAFQSLVLFCACFCSPSICLCKHSCLCRTSYWYVFQENISLALRMFLEFIHWTVILHREPLPPVV